MLQRITLFLTALVASLAISTTARAELRVVATVPTLAAIARDVGGEHVSVRSLSLPTQDPHFVDAKPSLALELSRADLLLAVGLGSQAPVADNATRTGRRANRRIEIEVVRPESLSVL